MPRPVTIIVTSEKAGVGTVRAYPDGAKDVLYEVLLYKVKVEGTDSSMKPVTREFEAYRFGVQPDASRRVKSPRVVGLADAQTHTLAWDYITTMNESAWRVYAGFFIHRGPISPSTSNWGSTGCVEICGANEWTGFNNTILEFSGADSCDTVSTSGTLHAQYEQAVRPQLRLKK